ncbi:MAG: hypothetical protein A2W52_03840 [Candidatus Taylorbacteria bacterium RIFCSPHIGHO2_02_49_25]|uniref:Uncharacterized protein n=1 Tax=Candidatus Taylorbacteria bacterium RIFCSPHIGHO2_02_49_25 TaxID=1802305 RepID=A0A1G2MHS8_9BACT|nr:MAG: hypothetical protein UY62_C0039G0030 [Parcubacteria group bacterium GW2011_GWF2_50_9]OHA20907.1 MAG: hypothetical protein A2759_01665 [Candidatus Taylorbacteria bacterium RIFCSPHIGHO2_01_FULL_49_60]OHA22552.1 MAG: hypothetical protein A2W52_03840 [Candidatus Taylorbacteria bacterium RIFCSPHIGHO2_02_49_25]OHA36748.1 MAG: hypothetical protein A2W65_01970 [Candidatus Taylorbacteria bacterium RIFCSPLOWO2_02_50_13]OHA42524.1 MAG: hypothetical protein A3H73_04015 [Candidatus Taylorbacteria ba
MNPDAGIQTAHSKRGEGPGLARAFGGKSFEEPKGKKNKKKRITRAVRELRERDGVDGRDLIEL